MGMPSISAIVFAPLVQDFAVSLQLKVHHSGLKLFCIHGGHVFKQDAGWKKVESLTLALRRVKYPTFLVLFSPRFMEM